MTNVYDPVNLKQIEGAADVLLRRLRADPLSDESLDSLDRKMECIKNEDITDYKGEIGDIEICVAKRTEDSEEVINYYLASMAEQSVFWLDEVSTDLVTGLERAVISNSHLGELIHMSHGAMLLIIVSVIENAVRAQFW